MIPSAFGQAGSEVIDATESNVFSLTVNGTGTVDAYQLCIYQNTTGSASVYDSGVVELSTPFYPTNYDGTKNRFEVTVPSNDSGEATYTTMVNEYVNGYKWTITLWETYDSGDPTSTAITSAENSIKTKIPSLVSIDATTAPATITSRSNLWKAIFTGTSSVMQFRWYLAEVSGTTYTTIFTGNWIHQTPQIWFAYDGLQSGKTYAVRVQVMTQDGVSVYSAWASSAVSYSTLTAHGATTVTFLNGGNVVGWSGIQYIEGHGFYVADDTASTNYSYLTDYPNTDENTLVIGSDTYVKFESSSTFDLSLDDEGVGVICLYPNDYSGSDQNILRITSEDAVEDRLLKHEGYVAGLFPSDSLYPSDTLYPDAGTFGHFSYTINGTTYTADSTMELPLSKYIVVFTPSAISIYESTREVA